MDGCEYVDGSEFSFPNLKLCISKELTNVSQDLFEGGDLDFHLLDKNPFILFSALHHATYEGLTGLVKELLENGADPNELNIFESSALHHACFRGLFDIVKLLVDFGSDVNSVSNFGHSPLHLATRSGNVELIDFLIQRGAVVQCESKNKTTPLCFACMDLRADVVRLLLRNGALANHQSQYLDDEVVCEEDECLLSPLCYAVRLPPQPSTLTILHDLLTADPPANVNSKLHPVVTLEEIIPPSWKQ
eukprot:GCRY01001055.1.p1 GENE.GCRY01001055.1~~GCRY01001055.1.p1  ORF type:complete len:247 (+),score=64.16 GCRY01001055.1:188-928(+)